MRMSGLCRVGRLSRDFTKEDENFSLGQPCKSLLGASFPSGRIFISGPCRCEHSSQKDFFLQENQHDISEREGGKAEGMRKWKNKSMCSIL